MSEEKFVLINLEDEKSKELAQVIASETSRKILNILAEKPLSETEIGEKLKVPLSTVHYNTQQLLKAEIIEIKDFLWSEKGKKIQLYQLANKLIIIAPKTSQISFLSKLKEIIPLFLGGTIISLGIYLYQKIYPKFSNSITSESIEVIKKVAAPALTNNADRITEYVLPNLQNINQNYALWFFLGVIVTLVLSLLIEYLKKKRKI